MKQRELWRSDRELRVCCKAGEAPLIARQSARAAEGDGRPGPLSSPRARRPTSPGTRSPGPGVRRAEGAARDDATASIRAATGYHIDTGAGLRGGKMAKLSLNSAGMKLLLANYAARAACHCFQHQERERGGEGFRKVWGRGVRVSKVSSCL